MPDVIALGQPTLGERELSAVAEVFESGWVAGQGPATRKFEAEFAAATSSRHCVAVNNCTAALHLAMLAHGVGPGDEVIVADYTFPATGHAVAFTGASPIFADIRPDIWSLDPDVVQSLITPATRGIIAVDVAGQPADYDELRGIAGKSGLFLVEDAACSAGASYQGRPAGSLADVACFSFHGRKGITCGEGGALTTDDEAIAAFVERTHNFGIESALSRSGAVGLVVPEFVDLGYNYKLSDISAAIIRVQLQRLSELIAARQSIADQYERNLGDLEEIRLPVTLPDRTHAWQSYIVTLASRSDRNTVAAELRQRGVQCNIGTYASHLQPVYGKRQFCPVSANLFERHLAIPMHANLTEGQVDHVARTLREVVASTR